MIVYPIMRLDANGRLEYVELPEILFFSGLPTTILRDK